MLSDFLRQAASATAPPDSVIVRLHEEHTTDYAPVIVSLVASVLVAAMAWWSTLTQRKIAGEATKAQRKLAEDATTTQREIAGNATILQRELAAKNAETQLEIARRASVVESRREWMREMRKAIADFEATAITLHRTPAQSADVLRLVTDMTRQMTIVVLLLDLSKFEHQRVMGVISAVSGWASLEESEDYPDFTTDERTSITAGREFSSFGDALLALDSEVSSLLEAAWTHIKEGV